MPKKIKILSTKAYLLKFISDLSSTNRLYKIVMLYYVYCRVS